MACLFVCETLCVTPALQQSATVQDFGQCVLHHGMRGLGAKLLHVMAMFEVSASFFCSNPVLLQERTFVLRIASAGLDCGRPCLALSQPPKLLLRGAHCIVLTECCIGLYCCRPEVSLQPFITLPRLAAHRGCLCSSAYAYQAISHSRTTVCPDFISASHGFLVHILPDGRDRCCELLDPAAWTLTFSFDSTICESCGVVWCCAACNIVVCEVRCWEWASHICVDEEHGTRHQNTFSTQFPVSCYARHCLLVC